jgi:hypothetical protein
MVKQVVKHEVCSEEVPCRGCLRPIKAGEHMIIVAQVERVGGIGSSPIEWIPLTEVCYHVDCSPQ